MPCHFYSRLSKSEPRFMTIFKLLKRTLCKNIRSFTQVLTAVNLEDKSKPMFNVLKDYIRNNDGLMTRAIRIYPNVYTGTTICMRVELYGCPTGRYNACNISGLKRRTAWTRFQVWLVRNPWNLPQRTSPSLYWGFKMTAHTNEDFSFDPVLRLN